MCAVRALFGTSVVRGVSVRGVSVCVHVYYVCTACALYLYCVQCGVQCVMCCVQCVLYCVGRVRRPSGLQYCIRDVCVCAVLCV